MGIFTELDGDWARLALSDQARRRLEAWSAEQAALAGHRSLARLAAFIRQPGHAAASDRLLAALVALARADDLAARVVLQTLVPGLRTLANDCRSLGDVDEVEADTVALCWERIRTYPLDQRPSRIAANVVLDTRKRLIAHYRRAAPACAIPTHGTSYESPGQELLDLIVSAVNAKRLTPAAATLIVRTRLEGETLKTVAAGLGQNTDAVRKRRKRAEHRLADFVL